VAGLGKLSPKKLVSKGKGAVKSASRSLSPGLSPVTYVPRTAARGYRSTTRKLNSLKKGR